MWKTTCSAKNVIGSVSRGFYSRNYCLQKRTLAISSSPSFSASAKGSFSSSADGGSSTTVDDDRWQEELRRMQIGQVDVRKKAEQQTTTAPQQVETRKEDDRWQEELRRINDQKRPEPEPEPFAVVEPPPPPKDDGTWQKELHRMKNRQQNKPKQPKRQQQQHQRTEQQSTQADRIALGQISKKIFALQRIVSELGHITTHLWEEASTETSQEQQETFKQCQATVLELRQHLQNGTLRPDRQHRYEFALVTEHLLQIYSRCGTILDDSGNATVSIYDEVKVLLELLKKYDLELSHRQCDFCVQTAAREGRYAEASDLYSAHIDPDHGGYLPVTSATDVQAAVNGLYCIARAAIQAGSLPVESVFNGVLKLTMVSPDDSEKYVLAAGKALGHVGEWKALRSYLESSYKSIQLGQPLVAAVMQACILCKEYDEAIAMFDNLVQGDIAAASEWQWGGGQYRLHPTCRDLAMQALGRTSAAKKEPSAVKMRALELYQQSLDQDCRISVGALRGIVSACERDSSWEEAVKIFLTVVDKAATPDELASFLASEDRLYNLEAGSESQQSLDELASELGGLLDDVMRACNSAKQFGVALLCLRLHELYVSRPAPLQIDETAIRVETGEVLTHSVIVRSLLPIITSMRNAEDLLPTTMTSLCGINFPHEATALFEAVCRIHHIRIPEGPNLRDKCDVYSFAWALRDASPPKLQGSWDSLHRHIHRVTAALSAIEAQGLQLTEEERRMLSSALATAIRESVAVSQPETGITLGKWVESRRIGDFSSPDLPVLFSSGDDGSMLPLPPTDPLLAAAIEVFSVSGRLETAQSLIQLSLGSGERQPSEWSLSYQEAMKALFKQGQTKDGLQLFRAILANGRNPTMFRAAAKGLKEWGDGNQIVDLYRQALSSGCFSEELSLLTMQSAVASNLGKSLLPFLRSIVGEIAKALGTHPTTWLAANYWTVKRYVRSDVARLLMGWNEYKTSHLDELQLALEMLESRSQAGLTPKTAALFTIMKSAANFEQMEIPYNKTKVPNVPRDREGWIQAVEKALEQAEDTALLTKPDFLDETAMALWRLGCNVECVDLVTHALAKGIVLNKAALQSAVQSAKNAKMEDRTGDIMMMLAE